MRVFGNLIVAIIAQMLWGNHLNFVTAIIPLPWLLAT